jgi:hypothetical protein
MSDDKVSLNRNVFGWYTGLKVDIEAETGVPVPSIGFGWETDPEVDGEFGVYNGDSWTWGAGGGPTLALDDLSDVTVPAPTNGQVLTYDAYAEEWIAEDPAEGGVSDHGALTGLTDDDHPQYQLKSLLTNIGDMIYATSAGVWARVTPNVSTTRKFLRQVADAFGIPGAPTWDTLASGDIPDLSATYAVASKGVTGGDGHDHSGGDGTQIDHGGLAGLTDDDHTQYTKHSLATAANDFLVASGAGTFIKKTLAEVVTILRTVLDSVYPASSDFDESDYTPTLTTGAGSNLDSATVNGNLQYFRYRTKVMVWGSVICDPTLAANTLTTLGISVPIASDFTSALDAAGNGTERVNNSSGNINADTANNRVTLAFNSPTTSSMTWRIFFGYTIK